MTIRDRLEIDDSRPLKTSTEVAEEIASLVRAAHTATPIASRKAVCAIEALAWAINARQSPVSVEIEKEKVDVSTVKCCRNCKWFYGGSPTHCRRYPPTVPDGATRKRRADYNPNKYACWSRGIDDFDVDGEYQCNFPLVLGSDYCGEFEPKETICVEKESNGEN